MRHLLAALVVFACSMGLISIAFAQNAQFREPIPDTYTVVKGDTLWDISATFLQNPWYWPEIWHVNTQIENPHLIYPGDVLRLVYIDGQPRITLDNSGRLQKLEPKARIISQGEAIPTISLDNINSFLSRSRIVAEEELKLAPYVVQGSDNHLLVGAGDRVYIRNSGERDSTGVEQYAVYGIYRRGDKFLDPETNEDLGVQAIDIGSGKIQRINEEVATMAVERTTEEVRIGDRLLRQEERPIDSTFFPSAPKENITGTIIAVESGVNQVGDRSVVVINRGTREGMTPGNVLAIYKRGGVVRDQVRGGKVKLPDERAGLLMVFRSFEKVSLAVVLEASRGLSVNDIVTNP